MDHNEDSEVEQLFIAQLLAQSGHLWRHIQGSANSIAGQGRELWREVILKSRFLEAIRRINLDASNKPWLDDNRLNQAWKALDKLTSAPGPFPDGKKSRRHALAIGRYGGRWPAKLEPWPQPTDSVY